MTSPESKGAAPGERPSPLLRLRRALGRVRRRFAIDTFDIFARRITPDDKEFTGVEGYEFRWGTAEDVLGCEELHTELNELQRELGARRLGMDHRLILATHEGLVVFTMWANPRNVNIPGLIKRKLHPDQWFIYKAYTSPDHRGRKLYGAGMRFVLAEMSALGLKRLVGYAHVNKKISRKGLARLEFESQGQAWSLAAPGLRRVIVSRQLAASFPEAVPHTGALPPLDGN